MGFDNYPHGREIPKGKNELAEGAKERKKERLYGHDMKDNALI